MLEDEKFFDIKHLAKFILNNKDSIVKLKMKNVYLEDFGVSFAPKLMHLSFGPDLQNIHIENVNLSKKGLKNVIELC